MNDESYLRKFLQQRIIRYLLAHPAAADNASGVRHWWVRDEEARGEEGVSRPMVEDALEDLLKRGLLVKRGNTPVTGIYAFNELARDAAGAFAAEAIEDPIPKDEPGAGGNG